MIVGVPRETYPGERRVALVPAVIPNLKKAGLEVVVETGAGLEAGYPDADYTAKGAKIAAKRAEVFSAADVLLQVLCYGSNDKTGKADLALLRRGHVLIGFLRPLGSIETIQGIAASGVTSFSIELMPRTTRAQSMDALSSMATICGYKAVLIAADTLPRLFPMLTTAAGTITPARVLIIGCGVAGLQAIATARRLGAVVSAYDVRPAVKEEVQSLGATFIELALETQEGEGGYAREQSEEFLHKQRELIGEHVAKSDIVITTAAAPGRRAPLLVTGDMVKGMRPGSVIVDLAAETGGNVELTKAGKDVEVGGVTIIGTRNVPSTMPLHASQLYARNVANLLLHLVKDGSIVLDFEDEITKGSCVTHGGEIVNERAKQMVTAAAK